ncbi:Heterokaryon incompatibility protein 6, OR allele [Fulvia fulva]|uniref:Heterokaryon incompatibility protein 6, OR allele n=1 Tax=Passalora fulva TaxID=5499 RepID=A0A9Q8P960_PASFU|nr:Heterokaryon incompatibility protein 6, OR allele [Fulvia fulva]KAK4624582.1 Heterokaryon incompatibility protein 6, OR allele [Fulvia fulva]KAK4624843.1 Heterokaryon incompatibility protein 6, OR allele [Fulvia fulva]UJO17611.1 Heterokaryon incompatibility protein 6, OR allele [Fulvia fulva]WPV15315.1 Heterokaryon incompatibility protein 6, OR allele [Fulvia fulva]WPV29442.1 Heterokaryon incompatibility protein 6, OR allele [Fulvia fulva]
MGSVHTSPRLPDYLEYDSDEPPLFETTIDPRLAPGFRSLSLDSVDYDHNAIYGEARDFAPSPEPGRDRWRRRDDGRPFAGTPDLGKERRRRRQRESDDRFEKAAPFEYKTVADCDVFRLATLEPGTGLQPVCCSLSWESSRAPTRSYCCLSYAWEAVARDTGESAHRDADILLDGYKFPVTKNLLSALQSLRDPKTDILIWIDQICINQSNHEERAQQVDIMKHIYNQAREIFIWLGDAANRSDELMQYAKKLRAKSVANRIMSPPELKKAIQGLLDRPWFQRVWVIPEVALSKHTEVVCGNQHISWEALVKVIRDVKLPQAPGFDRQVSLLGNPRQRIAIITQMIASQKENRAHTDVTQLLILGKSSKATDARDMVYAFYGLTHVRTFPDYNRDVDRLFVDIIHMYTGSILDESSYASWHDLTEDRKTFQLMSILYSAGALHQRIELPSWVPDWTFPWELAPIWCKTIPNFVTGSARDEWSAGIRTDFRAGGERVEDFEVIEGSRGMHQLRLSALNLDTILLVNEVTPASTPGSSQVLSTSPPEHREVLDPPTLRWGRHFFTTEQGYVGLATPGIAAGDDVAILLGGDVPVVLRRCPEFNGKRKAYRLLCECYCQSAGVMHGDYFHANWTLAEDVVLI